MWDYKNENLSTLYLILERKTRDDFCSCKLPSGIPVKKKFGIHMGDRIVSNINLVGTEQSTFPLVCENCLGDDPYVRMTKADNGGSCKICERAFTCFRWKAGNKGRFKSTIVCQLCARMKNVCQCCLLDLEFGLPVQLRDKYLAENEYVSIPRSRAGIDFQVQQNALALASSSSGALAIEGGYTKLSENPHLQRIARTAPYYNGNEAKICSFFLKGECNRGEMCPFRHERPKDGSLAKQDIFARYHGVDDPVAEKLQKKMDAELARIPKSPEDQTVTTMFITGIPVTVDQAQMTEYLESQLGGFGTIFKIKIIPTSNCGFVEFEKRASAEAAITAKFNALDWEGKRLKVAWARPKINPSSTAEKLNVPYPSMDPSNVGNSRLDSEKK